MATAFTAEDVPLLVAPGTEDCAPRAQASAASRVTATGFSIATPSGSDWTTKRSRLGFTFERKREGTAPCKTTHTYLLAERNFTMGDRSRLSEEEVAEDFRNMEEAGMRVMGVQVGQYDLTGVQRGVNTRGDKKLYFMKYRTVTPPMGRKSDRRAVADATLYLHFPSTFADDRFFFVFLDQSTCAAKTGDVPPQSMDDILPIVDSLHIDSSLR